MANRINITLDEDLLSRIDDYADSNSLTRSGFIALACSQYLDAMSKAPALKETLSQFFSLTSQAITGDISPNDYKAQIDSLNVPNK